MHRNSILMFEKYAKPYFKENLDILEIGPDDFPSTYKKLLNLQSGSWTTLEIDADRGAEKLRENHTVSTDGYKYPIEDEKFDLIFSAQVLEHVPNLMKWFEEKKKNSKA